MGTELSVLATRKAAYARFHGATAPQTLQADRDLRVYRLAAALKLNGADVLADALQAAGMSTMEMSA